MLISVIIPIFNLEKYIERCLISLINQSFKDFEIIVINDGSSDNSLSIVERYKVKFSNIRIISTPNFGVSAARNLGISVSTSDYFYFIDGDDYIESDCLMKISTQIVNLQFPDILLLSSNYIIDGKSYPQPKIEFSLGKNPLETFGNLLLKAQRPQWAVWNFLFSRKIIKINKILFDKTIKKGEDLLFVVKCLKKSKTFCFYDSKSYNYVIGRTNSAMSSFKNQSDIYKVINTIINDSSLNSVNANSLNGFFKWVLKILLNELKHTPLIKINVLNQLIIYKQFFSIIKKKANFFNKIRIIHLYFRLGVNFFIISLR
jgi:glycosyltransferase involved in cell wall biosynthesis